MSRTSAYNINSEDIFEKLLLDKQVRHISIEDNIKVINNLGDRNSD